MSIDVNEVKLKVQNYFQTNMLLNKTKIPDTASLLELGVIDSTGILELINFLQDEFSIVVEDDEILPENFDSIQNISSFIYKKFTK